MTPGPPREASSRSARKNSVRARARLAPRPSLSIGGSDGWRGWAPGPSPGVLPRLPPAPGPDPARPAAAGQARPLGPGPANAPEGTSKSGPVPGPDRGGVRGLVARDPGPAPGRRVAEVRSPDGRPGAVPGG